jgi:hypothetical protein
VFGSDTERLASAVVRCSPTNRCAFRASASRPRRSIARRGGYAGAPEPMRSPRHPVRSRAAPHAAFGAPTRRSAPTAPAPPDQSVSMPTTFADPTRPPEVGRDFALEHGSPRWAFGATRSVAAGLGLITVELDDSSSARARARLRRRSGTTRLDARHRRAARLLRALRSRVSKGTHERLVDPLGRHGADRRFYRSARTARSRWPRALPPPRSPRSQPSARAASRLGARLRLHGEPLGPAP